MDTNSDELPEGLGWIRTSSSNEQQLDANSTDSLAQYYLRQCLDYHEMQQRKRQVKVQNGQSQRQSQIQFVTTANQQLQEKDCRGREELLKVLNVSSNSFAGTANKGALQASFNLKVEEGRSRAQAILNRFQSQQHSLLFSLATSLPNLASSSESTSARVISRENQETFVPTAETVDDNDVIRQTSSTALFVEQRRKGLLREEAIKHQAIRKNWEYISHREGDRVRKLSSIIEVNRQNLALLQRQHQTSLHKRQLRQQQQLETTPEYRIGNTSTNFRNISKQSSTSDAQTAALYVSGLDTAVDTNVTNETTLRQLFGCFGQVVRIHLYRDKMSGALKGDGIITFSLAEDGSTTDLLQMVCNQMNGAELPSGNVLKVEPAKANYQALHVSGGKEDRSDGLSHKGSDETIASEMNHLKNTQLDEGKRAIMKDDVLEEDLDDFFDSLG